ncbi:MULTISPECIES: D-2-hydroxyacid dehydrogenase [Subtercola]|uniref:D-2-hydroxyacid dehydrogenase n=1 Tax=Subtercola vilae TaxID=2056433 RepID=A0A4V6U5B1_9MICO|nr:MULTISPECIES: D-2-hydroxyacid dehydrogenase [Subtercola]MEA9986166.1 D-2-hydroxyacid dehydrogenase [Subtercola sp. RTI3]TIH33554.1 D-2-hydroxyacid dehydrogenase [Subtercola vilae]
MTTKVLISTYLEPALVDLIRAEPDVEVLYAPQLVPVPRYASDHTGVALQLGADDEKRWLDLLAQADVAFDFDWRDPAALPVNAPRLKWVQATSAGIGAFMKRTGLDSTGLTATTAAGVHAIPLAEFALTGALHFVKGVPHLKNQQRRREWRRYTTRQLAGMRVSVLGIGGMGGNVIAVFNALGARVTGIGRVGGSYELPAGVEQSDIGRLAEVLPRTDILILCTALTPETEGLIGRDQIALLPDGAIVVNISRGQVIDEQALIDALQSKKLLGAALDVVNHEPLADDSPLWQLENVMLSPHSASTLASENETLTALFIDNLRRWRAGEPLKNLFVSERGY